MFFLSVAVPGGRLFRVGFFRMGFFRMGLIRVGLVCMGLGVFCRQVGFAGHIQDVGRGGLLNGVVDGGLEA